MFSVRGSTISKLRAAGRLPQLGQYAQAAQNILSGYETRKRTIQDNSDYTAAAKKKYLDQLEAEKPAARAAAHSNLEREWSAIRRDYTRLVEKHQAAADKAAAAWDYGRLAYEAQRVKLAIDSMNGNPTAGFTAAGQIRQAYEKARNSGDRILFRAWCENAPGLLAEKFHGIEDKLAAADLVREMEGDFHKLTTTQEIEALQDDAAALVVKVGDLATLTEQAERYFAYVGAFATNNEFSKLEEGVSLRAVYNPQDTDFENTLDITG